MSFLNKVLSDNEVQNINEAVKKYAPHTSDKVRGVMGMLCFAAVIYGTYRATKAMATIAFSQDNKINNGLQISFSKAKHMIDNWYKPLVNQEADNQQAVKEAINNFNKTAKKVEEASV